MLSTHARSVEQSEGERTGDGGKRERGEHELLDWMETADDGRCEDGGDAVPQVGAADAAGAPERGFEAEAADVEDATLMKNFVFKERKSLQIRLEAYGVTNSPQWGNPNTSFGSSTFGQITSAGGNRSLQVAAKFYY